MPERYYPRFLGVATPKGKDMHEFLITGKEEVGALAAVTALFASHTVDLNQVSTYLDGNDGFVFNLYADFARADCRPPQLVAELKAIEAVRTADVEAAAEKLFDSFMFPVMLTSDVRAVVILASALTNVETHFGKSLGQKGKHLMFESGRQAGITVLKNTKVLAQKSSTGELLAHVTDRLRTTGWGIFSIDTSEIEKGVVDVTVQRPFFSESEDVQESWYTFGLAAGVVEAVFGSPLVVASCSYKREAKELAFRLQEQSHDTRPLRGMR